MPLYLQYVPLPASNTSTWGIPGPTTSTSGTQTANTLYSGQIQVPVACSLLAVFIYNGATATGNILVGLFNSAGTQVAVSNSTAQSGTFAVQRIPFTATYKAASGIYYIGVLPSSSSSTFALTASFGASSAVAQGGFTMPSSITPPASGGSYVVQAAVGL